MKSRNLFQASRGQAVAIAMAVSLVMLAAEAVGQVKRGATVLVTTKQGSQVGGELVAVKSTSIVLLEPSGKDFSLDMAEVHSVLVIRKSKIGQGAILGLLAGVAGGYAGGAAYAEASGMCPGCEAPMARAGLGVLGGVLGLVGGVIVGASAGHDLNIILDDATAPSFAASLQKLRKYARVQDYR